MSKEIITRADGSKWEVREAGVGQALSCPHFYLVSHVEPPYEEWQVWSATVSGEPIKCLGKYNTKEKAEEDLNMSMSHSDRHSLTFFIRHMREVK